MLVIHPKDKTTDMLTVLYEGLEHIRIAQDCGSNRLNHILYHTPKAGRIMLLGHGPGEGLYFRQNDETEDFNRVIVGHPQAYHLRRHGGNLVGIWCHAVDFARAEGLHGLFSGMFISEMSVAADYGIVTTKEDMDQTNGILFARLRRLLDDGTPLHEIPARMKTLNDEKSQLAMFNYESFYGL